MYTLQINIEDAAPLDGVTPLNIDGTGVVVDRSSNRTIQVTVPAGTPFGRLNPGEVISDQMDGRTLILVGFSATAVGQPFPNGDTNILERVTPDQGGTEGVQQIADIGDVGAQGMLFGQTELFPFAHLLAITTTVGGPTRLIFVFKEIADDDIAPLGLESKILIPSTSSGLQAAYDVSGSVTTSAANPLDFDGSASWSLVGTGAATGTLSAAGAVSIGSTGSGISLTTAGGDIVLTGGGATDGVTLQCFDAMSFLSVNEGFFFDAGVGFDVTTSAGDITLTGSDAITLQCVADITLLTTEGNVSITAGTTAAGDSTDISLTCGSATAGNFTGGLLTLAASDGFGTGDGGSIRFVTGDSGAAGANAGGFQVITGGVAAGGDVDFILGSGGAGSPGGTFTILTGGASTGTAAGGSVDILTGDGGSVGGNAGRFTFFGGDGGIGGTGDGSSWVVSLGDSGTGVTGTGGSYNIIFGDALSTNGLGGSGTWTAGDGTGTEDGGGFSFLTGVAGGAGDPGLFTIDGTAIVMGITVDPSAASGVVAPISSILSRNNGGTGELWVKTGAADTAWTQVV